MNKKLTAVGLTAGLIAGAGAGLLLEMSGSAGASSQSAAGSVSGTDDETAAGGDTADAERPDPTERLQEVLKPLVDDGTITQAQADAVIEALQAAAPQGGPGGPGGPGRGPGLAVVAETLGLTKAEVRDAISNGQTLAQLAEANGSSAAELVAAILADIKTHMDEKVAAGDLTQQEADARLADAEARVTESVNNTKAPQGGPGHRGPGHPGGPGADDDDDAPSSPSPRSSTGRSSGS